MRTILALMLLAPVSSMATLSEYRVVCTLKDFTTVRFIFQGEISKAGTYDVMGEYTLLNSEAIITDQAANASIRFTTVDTNTDYKKMKTLSANLGRSGSIQLAFTAKDENTKLKAQTLKFNTKNKTVKADCLVVTESKPRPGVSGSN